MAANHTHAHANPRSTPQSTAETDAESAPPAVPRHLAIICDGNARWARWRGLPEAAGHAAGADRVVRTIRVLQRQDRWPSRSPPHLAMVPLAQKIDYCTLFAFSTENWSRPPEEIRTLFDVVERMARQYRTDPAVEEGRICIRLLGDLEDERMPEGATRELRALERLSGEACRRRAEDHDGSNNAGNRGAGSWVLTICLAINYGGRADILQAARRLAHDLAAGVDDADPNDGDALARRLQTAGIPDPDLIVRTGGESRLSNFLLWEAAYAELYFTDAPWPDFDAAALEAALGWYGTRRRRFGGRRGGEG